MELLLLRHGKPEIESVTTIRAAAMNAWIKDYDAAGITDAPDASVVAACQKHFVVTSPMPRALESVTALGLKPYMIIAALCEAPLPAFNLPLLKLTPLTWATLYRLFWMAGVSGDVESFTSVKKRAASVADELANLTEAHGRVLSVGHGFMNMLIARELQKAGWKQQNPRESGYWAGMALVR
ncbi:histidine phosphatase family protein [uncultured Cedecea sp.]|uniref:histidine phosphatase family protein n=1 Tax=uncultured Cedecea sp. TaxID=988762 RepID=UPI002624EF78|nr:histidine phosphatase family protein [uncultured Cedecea sp.]